MIVALIAEPINIRRTAWPGKYLLTGEFGCHNKVANAHAENK